MCGDHHWRLLQTQQGESDLIYRGGNFYLHTTCEVEEKPKQVSRGVLGVDLGIVNIAVDADGEVYSGNAKAHISTIRHRYRRIRKKLQKKGTKSAKRLLKKRARRESRFAKDTNHCISKSIVAKAQGTGCTIALEDLGGIRDRVTWSLQRKLPRSSRLRRFSRFERHQRAMLHSWAFYDLRQKIVYKAQLAGVEVVLVDPRNTSRQCPACGCIDKRNRSTQAVFSCVDCGFSGFADHIAAVNIGSRAAVNQPYISDVGFQSPDFSRADSRSARDKPPALAGGS